MRGGHHHVRVLQAAALLLLFSVAGAAQELDRYAPRDPHSLTLPRRPVTRRDYVEFLRPFARDYEMTPQADQWGWRHGPLRLMPPLAVFALDGDRELGQRVKADLRTFARWADQCVATKGVVFCLDAATFCTLCAQWEGEVAAGTRQQFVTVLLPHAPLRDASPLAAGIAPLADRPGVAAVQVPHGTRCELAILNAAGAVLDLECEGGNPVSTDAHAAYLDFQGGRLRRAQLLQGTSLKIGAETVFQQADRRDWETE